MLQIETAQQARQTVYERKIWHGDQRAMRDNVGRGQRKRGERGDEWQLWQVVVRARRHRHRSSPAPMMAVAAELLFLICSRASNITYHDTPLRLAS